MAEQAPLRSHVPVRGMGLSQQCRPRKEPQSAGGGFQCSRVREHGQTIRGLLRHLVDQLVDISHGCAADVAQRHCHRRRRPGEPRLGRDDGFDRQRSQCTARSRHTIHARIIRYKGDKDGAWWPYQDFPTSFSATGTGDRSTFFANWQTVLAEIGNRYGTNLDGFVFDDGCIYYSATPEARETSARSGNPSRLISWNGAVVGGLRYTDFQDLSFGEGSHGEATTGSTPAGGNGIFTSGPEVGLLQHSMFIMDGDWGVHTQGGNKISTGIERQRIDWSEAACRPAAGCVLPSFDMMMYEDGTVADSDLAILNDVRQSVFATTGESVPTGTALVNDGGSTITYVGLRSPTNRGAGDFDNDVHYTATNGSSVSYTFSGTGVDVLGPKSNASGQFNVSVDGALIGTFSEFANTYTAQSVIYSARHLAPGTHTIQLVKESSTYFQVDAFRVIPNSVELNDTSTFIVYTGAWTYGNNRGAGDFDNDVHYTPNNGDSATIMFTGDGDRCDRSHVIGRRHSEREVGRCAGRRRKGGVLGDLRPQQHYWGIRNQTPGAHTLTLTKTGGSACQLDAVTIWP